MRNFLKIASEVNVLPLLHAIQIQSHLWNLNDLRTHYPNSPHIEADDIWLRFNDRKLWESNPVLVMDDPDCINYPAWKSLPQAHSIVYDVLRFSQGVRLGRVMITRLAPGRKIASHTDGGAYAKYYSRYHIILQNFPGSLTKCGGETICPKPGEVYWFNNLAEHEVVNGSADDRLVMIVDVRCES